MGSSDGSKSILIVEIEQPLFDVCAPVLQRRDFEVDRFPDARRALELVSVVPFDAIIVGFPLAEMKLDEFIDAIFGGESAAASIAVLTSEAHRAEVEPYKQLGIDLILSVEKAKEEMLRLLCTLLGVAPRADIRVLVKLDLQLGTAGTERFVAQTDDISASGMLVSTPRLHPVGSVAAFAVTLPGDPESIRGLAEVARHTQPGVDRVRGMGLRFTSFEGNGESRLRSFVERTHNGTNG